MRILLAVPLALFAAPANAADLRIPEGMMLCHTLAEADSATHAGCWFARDGQRVKTINPMTLGAQLIIWSTDGSETAIVYTTRSEADRMQIQATAR